MQLGRGAFFYPEMADGKGLGKRPGELGRSVLRPYKSTD
jgi:hypothetical protein